MYSPLSCRQLALLFYAVVSSAYLCSAQENYALWLHSKNVVINTGASGYNVSGNNYRFPYLVRLTSNDFVFSEARGDGRDIRFANANGTHLPYQVEWWDTVVQKAAIWVRVDTIFGNNSTQRIIMYWGKIDAADSGSGSAVFETSNGFAGVWHLSEEGNLTASDATSNLLGGAPTGMTAASDTPGVIGLCRNFNNNSYIEITGSATGVLNLPENGSYTMSAWTYVPALPSEHSPVFSKGDRQYQLKILRTGEWEFVEFGNAGVGWQAVTAPAVPGAWFHIAGQRNGAGEYLWINGECVDSSIAAYANAAARNETFPMHIGHCPEYTSWYFPGMIDEPVISTVKRSAAWLKLSYENQKFIPDKPSISYPVKTFRIRLDSIVTITPVIMGMVDSLTISPAVLPLIFAFNTSNGEIMAWPMEVFTDTFYVRAYNVSGYAEDTLIFTTFDPAAASLTAAAENRVTTPKLLGLAGRGNQRIAFVMPQICQSVRSMGFSLFNCMGVRVWSKQCAVYALVKGVNSISLSGKIAGGTYFLDMTTILTGSSTPLRQRIAVSLVP